MKIEVTKKWCEAMAQREAGAEVSAGLIAADPIFNGEAAHETAFDESRVALGRFVHLIRRQQKLSVEALAERADVDVAEVMSIEAMRIICRTLELCINWLLSLRCLTKD